MKAVTICVEFDDLLRVTLPRYLPLFDEILVVTKEEDRRTQEYVAWMRHQHRNLRCFTTSHFELGGSPFNKGAALEAAMGEIGRDGWIATFDADMMLPEGVVWPELRAGCIYGTRRYHLFDASQWADCIYSSSWRPLPFAITRHAWPRGHGFCTLGGHFLLFHADDPALRERPWFSWRQRFAGGVDSDFVARWPRDRQKRLPFDMLHLGKPETNWAGRVEDRLDSAPIECRRLREQHMDNLRAKRRARGNYSWEEIPE
jgi:hypothetical protein